VSRTHVAQKPNGTEQIRKTNERTLTLKASTLNFSAVISAIGENVIHIWKKKTCFFKEKLQEHYLYTKNTMYTCNINMLQELCFKGDFLFLNILNHLGDVIISVLTDCGRSWVQSLLWSNQRL
jgi:hypothetical protein